jgi:hypothetical protein
MAKRARGAVRPGQRRAATRPQPRPNVLSRDTAAATPAAPPTAAAATRPGGLTSEEEARAAEIEARIVEQERAVETTRRRRGARERDVASIDAERSRGVQAGGLEAQASEEYAYVVRDVRRIVAIGGLLLVVLAVLFVLIEGAHVVRI